MVSIGSGIKPTRSMCHHQQRQYSIFNHPAAAQREVAIMRALKDGPVYQSIIRFRTKIKDTSLRKTLRELERAGMIGCTRTAGHRNCWYLV